MSNMEPSLQPSFTFPSRHALTNFASGILDLSSSTQRLLVKPAHNTDISISTALENPLIQPPTLDKDVFDVKGVLPVIPPIYVQPGLAEGMTELAKQTAANVNVTQVTSANNALKRGNFKAAENIIGRSLTSEEMANRTVTPHVRKSERNPNEKYHVSFDRGEMGTRVNTGTPYNYMEREAMLRASEPEFLHAVARHLGVSDAQVPFLKTVLGFTGDTVLGYIQGNRQQKHGILTALHYKWNTFRNMGGEEKREQNMKGAFDTGPHAAHPQRKPQPTQEVPIFSSPDSPRVGTEEESKYASDLDMEGDDLGTFPNAPIFDDVNGNVMDVPMAPPYIPSAPEFHGSSNNLGVDDIPMAPPMEFQPKSSLVTPQVLQTAQVNKRMSDVRVELELKDQIEGGRSRLRRADINQVGEAPQNPDAMSMMGQLASLIQKRGHAQKAESSDEEEVWRTPPAQSRRIVAPQMDEDMEESGVDMKMDLVNEVNQPNPNSVDQVPRLDENAEYRIHIPSEYYTETPEDIAERNRILDQQAQYRWERARRNVRGERGSGLGVRPQRTLKRKRLHPTTTMPSPNFLPDTSSFYNKGAIMSGRLMQQTGQNAVPISAQIQVQNTHQYRETPLQEWIKHPNMSTEIKPAPIPIAQYVAGGVGKRSKKVKFGGYMMDHHKLLSQSVLAISHPSGKKVKGMPNTEVSPRMKEVIHSIVTGGKVNTKKLNAQEKLYLRDLLHKSAANVDLGADVNVTPTKQLSLILGEIEAGNDAPELKTQLRKLLPALKRSKVLTLEQVSDISKHYL